MHRGINPAFTLTADSQQLFTRETKQRSLTKKLTVKNELQINDYVSRKECAHARQLRCITCMKLNTECKP